MQKRKSNSRLRCESLEPKLLLAANLVADINSFSTNSGNPRDVVAVGETAFFVAEDENGAELWKSDSSGTHMVSDIVPGPGSSNPFALTAGESVLFFEGPGGTWRSDGTNEGTFLLLEAELQAVSGNHALLFGQGAFHITNEDATLVSRVDVGDTVVGASVDHFTVSRDNVLSRINFDGSVVNWDSELTRGEYFGRADGVIGFSGGTIRTYRFPDDGGPPVGFDELSFPDLVFGESPIQQSGDLTFFRGISREETISLFRTDGTAEGTFSLGDFVNPTSFSSSSGFSFAVDGTGGMWFTAQLPGELGNELWFTDGTVEGTRLVRDIAPGSEIGSNPRSFTARDDRLWFVADNGTDGQQIWTSDGTTDGTIALTSLDNTTFDPQILGATDENVVFSVGTTDLGVELWTASNSASSVELVRNINSSFASSLPGSLTPVGDDQFVFAATSPVGRELWQTDLTSDGTSIILDIVGGSETFGSGSNNFVQFGDQTFFTANDGLHGQELWTFDASGTPQLFKDIELGPAGSHPTEFTVIGNTLYFVAQDSAHGFELWQSDGTPDGTRLVEDTVPGPVGLSPQQLVVANDELFFLGDETLESSTNPGTALWKLEGESVLLVHQMERGTDLGNLVTLNDQVYFSDILSRDMIPQTIDDAGNVIIVPGFEDFTRGEGPSRFGRATVPPMARSH